MKKKVAYIITSVVGLVLLIIALLPMKLAIVPSVIGAFLLPFGLVSLKVKRLWVRIVLSLVLGIIVFMIWFYILLWVHPIKPF